MSQSSIMLAFFSQLNAANTSNYPVAWPGVPFTPPASGIWIEPQVLPNQGLDNGLSASDAVVPQGLAQFIVWTRPGGGMLAVTSAAEALAAAFPKNGILSGLIRIQRAPWLTVLDSEPDKVGVLVTVPYSQ